MNDQQDKSQVVTDAPAHTPLPWSRHDAWSLDIMSGDRTTVCRIWGTVEQHDALADAEFIVRACNSHYDLLAALKGIGIDRDIDPNAPNGAIAGEFDYADARAIVAAIAKAEGK